MYVCIYEAHSHVYSMYKSFAFSTAHVINPNPGGTAHEQSAVVPPLNCIINDVIILSVGEGL